MKNVVCKSGSYHWRKQLNKQLKEVIGSGSIVINLRTSDEAAAYVLAHKLNKTFDAGLQRFYSTEDAEVLKMYIQAMKHSITKIEGERGERDFNTPVGYKFSKPLGLKLDKAIEDFKESKFGSDAWNRDDKIIHNYNLNFDLFLEVTGNKPLKDLCHQDIINYRTQLKNFPTKPNKRPLYRAIPSPKITLSRAFI